MYSLYNECIVYNVTGPSLNSLSYNFLNLCTFCNDKSLYDNYKPFKQL